MGEDYELQMEPRPGASNLPPSVKVNLGGAFGFAKFNSASNKLKIDG